MKHDARLLCDVKGDVASKVGISALFCEHPRYECRAGRCETRFHRIAATKSLLDGTQNFSKYLDAIPCPGQHRLSIIAALSTN